MRRSSWCALDVRWLSGKIGVGLDAINVMSDFARLNQTSSPEGRKGVMLHLLPFVAGGAMVWVPWHGFMDDRLPGSLGLAGLEASRENGG